MDLLTEFVSSIWSPVEKIEQKCKKTRGVCWSRKEDLNFYTRLKHLRTREHQISLILMKAHLIGMGPNLWLRDIMYEWPPQTRRIARWARQKFPQRGDFTGQDRPWYTAAERRVLSPENWSQRIITVGWKLSPEAHQHTQLNYRNIAVNLRPGILFGEKACQRDAVIFSKENSVDGEERL